MVKNYILSNIIVQPNRTSLEESEATLHEEDDDGHYNQEELISLLGDLSSSRLGLIKSSYDVLYLCVHVVLLVRSRLLLYSLLHSERVDG